MEPQKKGILDKLPAQIRHLIIGIAVVFFGTVSQAIIVAQSIFGIDWATTLKTAADVSITGGVLGLATLYLTPLTRQYGRKKKI